MGRIIHRFYNGNRSWKSDPKNRTLRHPIGLRLTALLIGDQIKLLHKPLHTTAKTFHL